MCGFGPNPLESFVIGETEVRAVSETRPRLERRRSGRRNAIDLWKNDYLSFHAQGVVE
jgi:hypothetical protein